MRRVVRRSRPLLFGLAVLVLWELLSRADTLALPRRNVPAPTDIARQLFDQGRTAVGQTLEGWAIGLAVATVAAVVLGVIVGSSRPL
jgi:ABC-type nitrate/sulfonate/bicarbonate transport system permease component